MAHSTPPTLEDATGRAWARWAASTAENRSDQLKAVKEAHRQLTDAVNELAWRFRAAFGVAPDKPKPEDPRSVRLANVYTGARAGSDKLGAAIADFEKASNRPLDLRSDQPPDEPPDPEPITVALDACVALSRTLSREIGVATRRGVPLGTRARTVAARFAEYVAMFVVGFLVFLFLLWIQDKAGEDAIAAHGRMAAKTLDDATSRARSARVELTGIVIRAPAATKSAPVDSVAAGRVARAFNQLTVVHRHARTALDALSQAQALSHADHNTSADSLTLSVSRAAGMADIVSERAKAFVGAAVDTLNRLRSVKLFGLQYADALDEEIGELRSGARIARADAPVRGGLQKWWIDQARRQFVAKLLFGMCYVLMGSAAVLLLMLGFERTSAKETIDGMVGDTAKMGPGLGMSAWPLIVPLGLVAGLSTGFTLAPGNPDMHAKPDSSHVRFGEIPLAAERDSTLLRILNEIQSTLKTMSKDVGEVKASAK